MKSITQIAKECNLNYNKVYQTIQVNKIIPSNINGFCFLDIYQEELLHYCLYRLGVLEEVVLESKMNVKETFEEFKRKTYGIRK